MKITHHKLIKMEKDFDKQVASVLLDIEFDENDNKGDIHNGAVKVDLEIKKGLGNKVLGYICLENQHPTHKYSLSEDEKVDISLYLWENWENII